MWERNIILKNIEMMNKNNLYKTIIGKSYFEAEKIYSNLRIVKENDVSQIIILNHCHDRCNVIIKNGIIIGIDGFY